MHKNHRHVFKTITEIASNSKVPISCPPDTFAARRMRTNFVFNTFLSVLFSLILILLPGCSHQPSTQQGPPQKILKASFEDVWKACQKALIQYPIRINNSDTGILQTDYVKGSKAFQSPIEKESHSSGYRYRILLRVVKGAARGDTATKVTIAKEVEVQRDFFSNPEEKTSDGLEEKVILYRIERELLIEKGIKKLEKLQEKKEQKAQNESK